MKEYLKMADVFKVGVSDAGIKVRQNYIVEGVDDSFKPMEYAAHAINSHDELVAEVERLRMSSELAIITLEEVDRVLTEKIKNGAYDLDDISGEVAYALERLSEHE